MGDDAVRACAKAQAVPAEACVDCFLRLMEGGWSKWCCRAAKDAARAEVAAARRNDSSVNAEGNEPAAATAPPQLLLGSHATARAWLVSRALPGLQRHPHLSGLLALLRKWGQQALREARYYANL